MAIYIFNKTDDIDRGFLFAILFCKLSIILAYKVSGYINGFHIREIVRQQDIQDRYILLNYQHMSNDQLKNLYPIPATLRDRIKIAEQYKLNVFYEYPLTGNMHKKNGHKKANQGGYVMYNIKEGFDQLKPWITQFTINGDTYGGNVSLDQDARITQFFDCFPDARRILDLGSLEGGQTFQLAKNPEASILGLEGRQANINKANYVKGLLGVDNVSFEIANLESTPLSTFGRFDAVFCSGLLYHLPKPWELIKEICGITDKLFIWTHYARDGEAVDNMNGYQGYYYQELGIDDPLSGLSDKSFRVTRNALTKMLRNYGYANTRIFADNNDHPNGACITLGAWK